MASLAEVRKQRGLPFLKRGIRVFHTHNQKWGTITGGNNSGNINVRFDGESNACNCHPTWKMKYYDSEGKVIEEFND